MAPNPGRKDGAAGIWGVAPLERTRLVQRPVIVITSAGAGRWHAPAAMQARTSQRALEIPPNGAQPTPDPAREEERGGDQHALEIQ